MLKLLMEQHSCKNCENLFEGRFCNVCGQKTAHRLDVSHIWHEVIHLFTAEVIKEQEPSLLLRLIDIINFIIKKMSLISDIFFMPMIQKTNRQALLK